MAILYYSKTIIIKHNGDLIRSMLHVNPLKTEEEKGRKTKKKSPRPPQKTDKKNTTHTQAQANKTNKCYCTAHEYFR